MYYYLQTHKQSIFIYWKIRILNCKKHKVCNESSMD